MLLLLTVEECLAGKKGMLLMQLPLFCFLQVVRGEGEVCEQGTRGCFAHVLYQG